MKVSIITVCYNAEKTIKDCIASVINQSYQDIEIIIIDGLSSDRTLEISHEISLKNSIILSERDQGIYDAMNKGLNLASGEIIHFLNADDMYSSSDIIKKVVEAFEFNDASICYGGINYIDQNNNILSDWSPSKFIKGSYKNGWHTPHPGFFAKRSIYQRLGGFDVNLRIASDFDLMKRFMEDANVQSQLLPFNVVNMRSDGASSSLTGIAMGWKDIRRTFQKTHEKVGFGYFARRYLSKIMRKIITHSSLYKK